MLWNKSLETGVIHVDKQNREILDCVDAFVLTDNDSSALAMLDILDLEEISTLRRRLEMIINSPQEKMQSR
jgi:hypothetical protein